MSFSRLPSLTTIPNYSAATVIPAVFIEEEEQEEQEAEEEKLQRMKRLQISFWRKNFGLKRPSSFTPAARPRADHPRGDPANEATCDGRAENTQCCANNVALAIKLLFT